MDGKRTRCLQIVSLHVPICLLPFLRYSEIFVKKSSFYHTPLHSTPPLGGFLSEYRHPLWDGKTRMVSLSDGKKMSKISLFILTWSTNVMDRQTDRHCVTAKTALASHRAVKLALTRTSDPNRPRAEILPRDAMRSTFCIEAIQKRSVARPLCDSRASCHISTNR